MTPNLFTIAVGIRLAMGALLPVATYFFGLSEGGATAVLLFSNMIFPAAAGVAWARSSTGLSAPPRIALVYAMYIALGVVGQFLYSAANPDFAMIGLFVDVASLVGLLILAGKRSLDTRAALWIFLPCLALLTWTMFGASTKKSLEFVLFQDVAARNAYGALALIGFVLATVTFATRGKILDLLLLVLMAAAVAFSFSKTAWGAAPAVLITSLVVTKSWRRLGAAAVVSFLIGVVITTMPQLTRPLVDYGQNYSRTRNLDTLSRRDEIWIYAQNDMDRSAARQVFGNGYNAAVNFDLGSLGRIYSLHSDFWTIYHSGGLVGLALIAGLWAWVLARLAQAYGRQEAVLPAALSAFLLVRGYTEANYGATTPTHFLFWILLAAVAALPAGRASQAAPSSVSRSPTSGRSVLGRRRANSRALSPARSI